MKLLFCEECNDVFSLSYKRIKSCSCKKISGQYIDRLNAEYVGPAKLLGFNNQDFLKSIENEGKDFIAFSINSKLCHTFKKVEELTKL